MKKKQLVSDVVSSDAFLFLFLLCLLCRSYSHLSFFLLKSSLISYDDGGVRMKGLVNDTTNIIDTTWPHAARYTNWEERHK